MLQVPHTDHSPSHMRTEGCARHENDVFSYRRHMSAVMRTVTYQRGEQEVRAPSAVASKIVGR